MTMMIEPNPVTPDRKTGMFVGNLHWGTKDGKVNLQAYPLKLIVVWCLVRSSVDKVGAPHRGGCFRVGGAGILPAMLRLVRTSRLAPFR